MDWMVLAIASTGAKTFLGNKLYKVKGTELEN